MDPIRKEFEKPELKKLVEEAYPVEKKKKGPPAPKGGAGTSGGGVDNSDIMSPNRLDIRVGRITKVDKVRWIKREILPMEIIYQNAKANLS